MSQFPFQFEKVENGININGWSLRSTKLPISNTEEIDEFELQSNVRCPEMTFLKNSLEITHTSGFSIKFNGKDALESVRSEPSEIKVQDSHLWKGRVCDNIITVEEKFDWTYTTEYTGAMENKFGDSPSSQGQFPMDLITRQDPILWYDQVQLFEDELHDNGVSTISVKVRVMPMFFLILCRFWLRVDGVLLRVFDYRVFHQFGTTSVLEDIERREAPLPDIQQIRMPSHVKRFTDPNLFSRFLPVILNKSRRINLSEPETEKAELVQPVGTAL